MYSKSDKDAATAAPIPPRFKPWSIAHRLTIHYAFCAFVIFNVSIALLHWGLVTIVEKQSNRYLQDEISVIESLYGSASNIGALGKKFEVGYAARELMKTYARVVDTKGNVLLQTFQMSEILPIAAFPSPVGAKSTDKGRNWNNGKGKLYIMRSVWLDATPSNANRRILQIALDVTNMERILVDFRLMLLATIAFGTLISAALAAVIVNRGLRPLTEITERTTHITAENLDLRMNLSHWPKEVKVLASAFDEMLDRLQDSFDRLSSYVSNMAHELRTPISVLMGESEVALTKARTALDYRRVIESNMEEYERLSRIIDSLLFIARTDVQKSDVSKEEIDVCREIEKIIDYYLPIAEDKGIIITCRDNAILYADPTLFRRAVSNLVSNSLHYTEAGGKITISSTRSSDRTIEVSVSDTGCGIPEADLPQIMDRFYRVDATRHMNKEGTGLGLAIVKAIMDLHGGKVHIESELAKGTSITLIFPHADITNLSS